MLFQKKGNKKYVAGRKREYCFPYSRVITGAVTTIHIFPAGIPADNLLTRKRLHGSSLSVGFGIIRRSWFHYFIRLPKVHPIKLYPKHFPAEIHTTIGKNHHFTGKTDASCCIGACLANNLLQTGPGIRCPERSGSCTAKQTPG
ncbi:hypothetical protein ACTJJB_32810 [Chitinophaga sp. 22536]|uniref:hypothetical protein n=1 Tax=unclassified Chitinophaga TaxID=2619133 RepID=UPI003F83A414